MRESPIDWRSWTVILVVAAVLRLYGIGIEPLWLDEGYSWWDAQQSLGDLWRVVTQCDPHPPLYAVVLKLWTAVVGDSPAAMRALGGLAGVATTAAVLFAGREISARVAWIAGLAMAISPFQIEFAHEARPYALLALGAALLLFGWMRILRSLREPVRARPGWIAFIVGSLFTLWTNNTAVFLVAASALLASVVFSWDAFGRRRRLAAVGAFALIGALWLPYLPIYLMQAQGVANDFWIPKPDLWRVGNELRFVVGLGSFEILGLLMAVAAAGAVLLFRGEMRREALVLSGLVALPVALNFTASVLVKPVFIARALIVIGPPFVLLLAVAMAAIKREWMRNVVVGGFVMARLATVVAIYDADRKEQWDDIARYIARQGDQQALVMLVPNELALPLGAALEEEGTTIAMRGVPADFPAPGWTARYPSGKCTPSVVDQDLSQLASAARVRRTVILVTRRNNVYDPNERTQSMLRSIGMRMVRQREFMPGYLRVQTYLATPPRTAQAPIIP